MIFLKFPSNRPTTIFTYKRIEAHQSLFAVFTANDITVRRQPITARFDLPISVQIRVYMQASDYLLSPYSEGDLRLCKQVAKKSVATNNSSSRDFNIPDYQLSSRFVTRGFKPLIVLLFYLKKRSIYTNFYAKFECQ